MNYIVLATVRNVLGQETEIAANQLGALSIEEFCFDDRIKAINAAYDYAEEFRTHPERVNHINAEIVYVTKVEAYRAYEKENGDIDYDNLEQILYSVIDAFCPKYDNRTYAQAYTRLTEFLFEYFRLYGLEEQSVQIDGIDSMEAGEEGNGLMYLVSDIRFTVYSKDRESKMRFISTVRQASCTRYFPEFEAPKKMDE